MCKISSPAAAAAHAHAHAAAAQAHVLDGWFHPSAVDDIAQWSAANASQLLQQDVTPISQQELRLCVKPSPSLPLLHKIPV